MNIIRSKGVMLVDIVVVEYRCIFLIHVLGFKYSVYQHVSIVPIISKAVHKYDKNRLTIGNDTIVL